MSNPIIEHIKLLAQQYNVSQDKIAELLSEIITRAYNKQIPDQAINVRIDMESGKIVSEKVFKVIEDTDDYDDFIEIPKSEANQYGSFSVGDECKVPFDILSFFKKNEILTIMQVFKQKLIEINNARVYEKWSPRLGDVINCMIEKYDHTKGFYIIDLDDGNFGFMSRNESIPGEDLKPGQRYKFYIKEVKEQSKGWPIILSRADAKFVQKLLEEEIPEIGSGEIVVEAIERIAGFKTKLAVSSANTSYDPASVVVGPKGFRVKTVSDLLNGEKIEVIKYTPDKKELLISACGINNLVGIKYVEAASENEQPYATLVTTEKLLPVIIGKKGNNIKLISKLVNCSIDINTVEEAKLHNIQYEQLNSPESLNNIQSTTNVSSNRKWSTSSPKFESFKPNKPMVEVISNQNILEEIANMSSEELAAKYDLNLNVDINAQQSQSTYNNYNDDNLVEDEDFEEPDEFENNDLADAFADEIAELEKTK